ncbi:MDR family MFS transporter [Deinococcus roseus]|uniref:MFS transporter n=1 Tax=Deinococcus roseus TaxID=392414 RepID=A0ABQ2D0S2_9DEIO|nr:MDR family MFS transporter [Deinococcus roseus]GGJ40110.1 MFS transporter [Deinococcus roseus]
MTETPQNARPNQGPSQAGPSSEMPKLTQQQATFTLVGLMLGIFLSALDQTIVATAAPIIQKDLDIPAALFSWLTTSYLLASTVMVPVWGKLGDIYGRRRIYMTGLSIFLFGSVLCGLAQNGMELVWFRGIQGLGSAALFTTALAAIADIFPPQQRAKFGGLFGAMFGISSVIGPLLGGWLTDSFSWHWIFYVNVPLGAIAIVFILSRMPSLKRDWGNNRPKVDWAGTFWLLVAAVPLLIALSLGKNEVTEGSGGFLWSSWQILSMFALSVVGWITFYFTEKRVKDPIINMELFGIRAFAWGNVAAFVAGAAFFAAVVFLPLFMVNVVGLSATRSGLTTLPLTFGIVLGNVFSGQLVARLNRYKIILLVAMVILATAFALMAFTLDINATQFSVSWKMFLIGIGLGPTIPLFTLAIQSAVEPRYIGVATSVGTFSRQLGNTVGIAILGSIFASALSQEMTSKLDVIKKDLPAALQKQFEGFGSGGSGGEGSTNGNLDTKQLKKDLGKKLDEQKVTLVKAIRDQDKAAIQSLAANENLPEDSRKAFQEGGIQASIQKGFDGQRDLFTRAIKNEDKAAIQELLASANTPQQLKDAFKNGSIQDSIKQGFALKRASIPASNTTALAGLNAAEQQTLAQVPDQTLKQVLTGLDAAEARTLKEVPDQALKAATQSIDEAKVTAEKTIDKVGLAFKESITDSIKALYKSTILIVALAFLVTVLMPEVPMRSGNRPPAAAE